MQTATTRKATQPDRFPGFNKITATTGVLSSNYMPYLVKASLNLEEALNLQVDNTWLSADYYPRHRTIGTRMTPSTEPQQMLAATHTFNKALQLLSTSDLSALIEAQTKLVPVVARHPQLNGAFQILWLARSSGLKHYELAFLIPLTERLGQPGTDGRYSPRPSPAQHLERSDQLEIIALPQPMKNPSAFYRLSPYLPLQPARLPRHPSRRPTGDHKDRRTAQDNPYIPIGMTRSPSTSPSQKTMPSPSKRRRSRQSPAPAALDHGLGSNSRRGPGRPKKMPTATDDM